MHILSLGAYLRQLMGGGVHCSGGRAVRGHKCSRAIEIMEGDRGKDGGREVAEVMSD